MPRLKQILNWPTPSVVRAVVIMVALGTAGLYAINQSYAVTSAVSSEAETGTLSDNAEPTSDTNASGDAAVKFSLPATTPPTPGSGAMPVGDLAGWRQVMAEDFKVSGASLPSGWGKYSGNIPSMPGGVWDPARVSVADGMLRLLSADRGDGTWTSGGVGNDVGARLAYGK